MTIWSDHKVPAYLGICKGDKMNMLSSIHVIRLSVIIKWIQTMYPDESGVHIAILTCRPDCNSGTNLSRYHHTIQSFGATPYLDYKTSHVSKANKYVEAITEKEIEKTRKEHKEKSPNKNKKDYYNK